MTTIFISSHELMRRIGTANAPIIVDNRRRPVFDQAPRRLPASYWRDHMQVDQWTDEFAPGRDIVCACIHGHNVSQLAASRLRALGRNAMTLEGGIEAWENAGYVTVGKSRFADAALAKPTRWVTRTNPKIDRIACPWLIRRFIDPRAEILYVDPEQVSPVAEELGATAFDVKGAPIEHDGERCSFDTLLDAFGIEDSSLRRLALVVRGADTARFDLAPQAAGLLAVSLGNSAMSATDEEALERGFPVYDAIYAWLLYAHDETHNWPKVKA
jgi:rhodanese-related sulfurtransferase